MSAAGAGYKRGITVGDHLIGCWLASIAVNEGAKVVDDSYSGVLQPCASQELYCNTIAEKKPNAAISPVLSIRQDHPLEAMHEFDTFGPCGQDGEECRCRVVLGVFE